jgi:hypothetical protein
MRKYLHHPRAKGWLHRPGRSLRFHPSSKTVLRKFNTKRWRCKFLWRELLSPTDSLRAEAPKFHREKASSRAGKSILRLMECIWVASLLKRMLNRKGQPKQPGPPERRQVTSPIQEWVIQYHPPVDKKLKKQITSLKDPQVATPETRDVGKLWVG